MRGLKIIPHSTMDNTNIKDIVKALHEPKRYTERYNFSCIDKFMEEGKPIPIKNTLKPGTIKKLLEPKEIYTDLLVLQNTFIYEIQITKDNIEFLLLDRDLEKVKKIYSKYIDKIKLLIIKYQ